MSIKIKNIDIYLYRVYDIDILIYKCRNHVQPKKPL